MNCKELPPSRSSVNFSISDGSLSNVRLHSSGVATLVFAEFASNRLIISWFLELRANVSGIASFMSLALMATPLSMRSIANLTLPEVTASCNGVLFRKSVMLMLYPNLSNSRAKSRSPFRTNKCRVTVSFSQSAFVTASWPSFADHHSGVWPLLSWQLSGCPRLDRVAMALSKPKYAAKCAPVTRRGNYRL